MQGRRTKRTRRLATEMLERRDLLAADLPFSHNFLHPEDVDGNNAVTVFDAIAVVGSLRNAAETESANNFLSDVNGDRKLNVFDALLVIGTLRSDREFSQAPLENRIERLREALDADILPEHVDPTQAQIILETLENGGRPEVGDEILPSRFDELRESNEWELANDVLAALEEAGVETSRAKDWIQDIRELIPDSEQPIQELIDEIHASEGAVGPEFEARIEGEASEESGKVDRWLAQIDSELPEGETPLRDLFEQFRSDNIDEFTDELLAALEAEGVDTATAQQWIDSFRDLTPDSDTPWRDLIGRLRSDQSGLTADVLEVLRANGVETGVAQNWIDDLSPLLPDTDTPWADLLGELRSDQNGELANQLLAILEANGVVTGNADEWIEDFAAILPDTETPLEDLLKDLRGENGDAVLADILAVLRNNGVDTSVAESWIADILAIFPDTETPLADYLEQLGGENGEEAVSEILVLLQSNGVNTSAAQPWIQLALQLDIFNRQSAPFLPAELDVTPDMDPSEGEWFDSTLIFNGDFDLDDFDLGDRPIFGGWLFG